MLKLRVLVPVFAALILAACQNQPAQQITVERPRGGPAQGIDLATDSSDVLNEIKGSQVDFVARYYRHPDSRWPTLSASEARRLSSLGIKLVVVFESHSHRPGYFSYSAGYTDAVTAYGQARALRQPPGSAIYFAVDFDARRQALDAVQEYFRGVAAGFAAAGQGNPVYQVGVYGSGAVCEQMKQAGLARYAWLSNSFMWDGSMTYDGWNIRQGDRHAELSFNHDSNEARGDYGGFVLAGDVGTGVDVAPRDIAVVRATSESQRSTASGLPSF
jgi:hypothetical protein